MEEEFEQVYYKLQAYSDKSPKCYFRTLVDLLLGHYMLTYGENYQTAEILDLFTFEFPSEGPTYCLPLIFTTRTRKQNQYGRLKTIRALQNQKPFIYILNGLAFYLLYRQDQTNKPFPNFQSRLAQYNTRLMKATTRVRAASRMATASFLYGSQWNQVVKAFEYTGITLQKKTYVS